MFPVSARNIGAAKGTSEYRHLHPHLVAGTVGRFSIYGRESGLIGIRVYSLCSKGISHDIEMGIVNGVVFIRTGSYAAERFRIKEFSPSESGPEHIAVSLASVNASTAYAGLRSDISRAVSGLKSFISIGSL